MTHKSFRESTGSLIVLALLLVACSKNDNPTEPTTTPTNAPLYGNWIGTLIGPDSTQRSGWQNGSVDSVWIVFTENATHTGGRMDFLMAPVGTGPSLSPPAGACRFVRYASALNSFSDPNVSFRVNLSHHVSISIAQFQGTRNSNTLAGTMLLSGDTLAGRWTATLCTTCPNASTTTSIEPSQAIAGSVSFTLVVNGTNFTPCSVVKLNDVDLATTFRSETQITGLIDAVDLASAGTRTITVFTPVDGGGTSNAQTLTIVP